VIIILVPRGSLVQAIEYTKLHGSEIHGVNIQNAKGKAKVYQVKQVIRAIERLEEMK